MRYNLAEVREKSAGDVSMGNRAEQDVVGVRELTTACSEAKGVDVTAIPVGKQFGIADNFIIASGRSDRHVQGIANRVIKALEDRGIEPYSVQGLEEGQWVVIDCVETIVHIFYEPLRSRYDLEGLWGMTDEDTSTATKVMRRA